MTYRMVDIIQKKRDGGVLTADEIQWFVKNYVAGDLPDYQMAALSMAIYFRGMTVDETAALTMAMAASGAQIDLSDIPGIKVDKHSTGGVGDKVSLILVPLVASFGVPVAKMSGRGLGHTGGTIDKLESIPGFTVEQTVSAFKTQVRERGLAIIGQSGDLDPADKLLYALRDVTATVDSIPLIASSIMSKKIAAGADAILLDVTVGDGAFMKNLDDARELARRMVDLGNAVGRKTVAVLTDMDQPLGHAIGNRNEIAEAVEVLTGGSDSDFRDYIGQLAQVMLRLAGRDVALDAITAHFDDGSAYQKFLDMLAAQGGDPSNLTAPLVTRYQEAVTADRAGVITREAAQGIGILAMKLGAGRATKADRIDFEAGIQLLKKIGDPVEAGETIATLHSNRPITPELVAEFTSNLTIGASAAPITEIIEIIE